MGPLLQSAFALLLVLPRNQATVAGTVRDAATGEPIAGAVVTLTDLDRATITGPDGRYLLHLVPAGPQHLSVRFIGYAQHTLHALVPSGGHLEINVSLRPVPIRLPTIEVRPHVIVRGGEDGRSASFPDRLSSIAAIANHPLLAEPDALQALGGGEVELRPEAPSGVHIRGGDADQTSYLLDGFPVLSPYHTAGVFTAWNPDALSQVQLSSVAPPLTGPAALSGSVNAETRTSDGYFGAKGGISNTQARLTLDGPLGRRGSSYLVSARTGLPNIVPAKNETSYLLGGTSDWLGKVETPILGGRLRLLGYYSLNEINTSATLNDSVLPAPPRNVFEWNSRSLGGEWSRAYSTVTLRFRGWSATGEAAAAWAAESAQVAMDASRRDAGLLAMVELRPGRSTTAAGIRVERSSTSYRIASDSAAVPPWRVDAETPVLTLFAEHTRPIGPRVDVRVGGSVAGYDGDRFLDPRAQLQWRTTDQVTFSVDVTRQHQFAQSLRNPESVVGTIFPADLYLGAGVSGVPVARSDLAVLALAYRPSAAVHVGIQGYARAFDRLLLVAPRGGEPFATDGFTVGSGSARGLSLDASIGARRYGILASYAWQRVRRQFGDTSYVPESGASHLLEGGVILFPTATLSVRLGAAGIWGRRATAVSGGLEWESCNLIDRGCEFRGNPHHGGEVLGGTPLPAYFRVDLGIRKHWHVTLGGRDAVLALFGSVTNLFDRINVLTYATDPVTGAPVAIAMRPRIPLAAGLDLRF